MTAQIGDVVVFRGQVYSTQRVLTGPLNWVGATLYIDRRRVMRFDGHGVETKVEEKTPLLIRPA